MAPTRARPALTPCIAVVKDFFASQRLFPLAGVLHRDIARNAAFQEAV